jgi:hypothetical protein
MGVVTVADMGMVTVMMTSSCEAFVC